MITRSDMGLLRGLAKMPGSLGIAQARACAAAVKIIDKLPKDTEIRIATIIQKLWNTLSIWSQQTFGTDQERGPIAPLKHLKLEADEAIESGNLEEFADCLLLILDAARRRGMTLESFIQETKAKLVKCQKRQWPKPINNEPLHHIEEEFDFATNEIIQGDKETEDWERED